MKKIIASMAVVTLAVVFVAGPAWAQNQQYTHFGRHEHVQSPTGDMMLYDLVLVRPAGIAACAIGLVGSVLAFPFAAMSHSQDKMEQRLIKEPFDYTFKRPLGDFDH